MKRNWIVFSCIVLLVGGGLGAWFTLGQRPLPSAQSTKTPAGDGSVPVQKQAEDSIDTMLQKGRYVAYSEAARAEAGYATTIIFFFAPWCPECRGFDQAISRGNIPDGTQILKVDYDSSRELRQRYGVTIQSTFVRVSASGDKQTLWTGYGKEKSVDAIIEHTQ